ncbi:hypothetical protein V5799_018487, partial [Amblyomma americanum]
MPGVLGQRNAQRQEERRLSWWESSGAFGQRWQPSHRSCSVALRSAAGFVRASTAAGRRGQPAAAADSDSETPAAERSAQPTVAHSAEPSGSRPSYGAAAACAANVAASSPRPASAAAAVSGSQPAAAALPPTPPCTPPVAVTEHTPEAGDRATPGDDVKIKAPVLFSFADGVASAGPIPEGAPRPAPRRQPKKPRGAKPRPNNASADTQEQRSLSLRDVVREDYSTFLYSLPGVLEVRIHRRRNIIAADVACEESLAGLLDLRSLLNMPVRPFEASRPDGCLGTVFGVDPVVPDWDIADTIEATVDIQSIRRRGDAVTIRFGAAPPDQVLIAGMSFQVSLDFGGTSKRNTPAAAIRQTAAAFLEECGGSTLLFTDGSVLPATGRAAAALVAPQLGVTKTCRLSFPPGSSTAAELARLHLATDLIAAIPAGPVEVLCDSRPALQLLSRPHDNVATTSQLRARLHAL